MSDSNLVEKDNGQGAFILGYFLVSKDVSDMMKSVRFNLIEYLHKHATCDWSDMCDFDQAANHEAIELGDRIFSAYKLPEECLNYVKQLNGELISDKIYVVTEADRSFTTMLFPHEY